MHLNRAAPGPGGPDPAQTAIGQIERGSFPIWEIELRVFRLDQEDLTALLRLFIAPDGTVVSTEVRLEHRGLVIDQLSLADVSPVSPGEWAALVAPVLQGAGFDPSKPMDYCAELDLGNPGGVAWEVGQRPAPAPPHSPPPRPWSDGDRQWLYFIQAGEGGPIKIGVARNPLRRCSTLQTGADATLSLLGAVPGDLEMEGRLHAEFASSRRRGEWFEPTAALLERVRELTAAR